MPNRKRGRGKFKENPPELRPGYGFYQVKTSGGSAENSRNGERADNSRNSTNDRRTDGPSEAGRYYESQRMVNEAWDRVPQHNFNNRRHHGHRGNGWRDDGSSNHHPHQQQTSYERRNDRDEYYADVRPSYEPQYDDRPDYEERSYRGESRDEYYEHQPPPREFYNQQYQNPNHSGSWSRREQQNSGSQRERQNNGCQRQESADDYRRERQDRGYQRNQSSMRDRSGYRDDYRRSGDDQHQQNTYNNQRNHHQQQPHHRQQHQHQQNQPSKYQNQRFENRRYQGNRFSNNNNNNQQRFRSKYNDPSYHPQTVTHQVVDDSSKFTQSSSYRARLAEPLEVDFHQEESELASIFDRSDDWSSNHHEPHLARDFHTANLLEERLDSPRETNEQRETQIETTEQSGSSRMFTPDGDVNQFNPIDTSSLRSSIDPHQAGSIQEVQLALGDLNVSNRSTTSSQHSVSLNREKENGSSMSIGSSIPSTSTQFHPRLAPADRSRFEKVWLKTNHFPLELDPNQQVFRYDVNVEMIGVDDRGRETIRQMCRGPRDDGESTRRHELVRLAVRRSLEAYRMLNEEGAVVHDDAATLFTNQSIEAALKPHQGSVTIAVEELPDRAKRLIGDENAREFRISIQPCTQSANHFNLGEAQKKAARSGEGEDRSLRQFLELLTTQMPTNSGKYIFYGMGKGFLSDRSGPIRDIGLGQERREGITKGIHFLETEGKEKRSIIPSLVLDAKTGTFFTAQSLVGLICAFNRWTRAIDARWTPSILQDTSNYIKGIRVKRSRGPGTFMCAGLYLDDQGRMITIHQCTEPPLAPGQPPIPSSQKYKDLGLTIKLMNWPMVLAKVNRGGRGDRNGMETPLTHPAELLDVDEHQRVPLHKAYTQPEQAAKPYDRWRTIHQHLRELDLAGGGNSLMERFGVRISRQSMEVEGFRRPMPIIHAAKGVPMPTMNNTTWKTMGKRFADAAHIAYLYMAWNKDGMNNNGALQLRAQVEKFAQKLKTEASTKGMRIDRIEVLPQPIDLKTDLKGNGIFKRAAEMQKSCGEDGGPRVIVIYIDSERQKTHGLLKLAECRFQVVTQHITAEKVLKACQMGTLLENILLKLNVKMLGINHSIVPESFAQKEWFGDSLIIGYDVAHPTGLTVEAKALNFTHETPSVVGFSANCGKSRDSFVGDFAFQDPLKERVNENLLNSRIKWILDLWTKNRNRERLPETVFIFRDGVSEGQYKMVKDDELEAIREACDEYENGYQPKFVLIICTKRHNTRFVKETQKGIENADAMTVVDRDLVRADLTEFYAQTHKPNLGTGKMTKYELLVSDLPDLTQDTLQAFTMALAFQHQITAAAISLPEPVYQADEWAKRGNDVFKAYRDLKYRLPRKGNDPNARKNEVDWELLTKNLSYMGKPLDGTRCNA